MANRKDDLLLHFKFNDLNTIENTVDNSVNPVNKGKVSGADLVVDDHFGACLNFDGEKDNVLIADNGLTAANPEHTLSAWLYLNDPKEGNRFCVMVLGQYGSGAHHWLLNYKTTELGAFHVGPWNNSPAQIMSEIRLQEWTHVATTYQNGKLTLYLNGLPAKASDSTFNLTENKLTLAAKVSEWHTEKNFKGKMAHLRLYRRALTAEEIKADMLADKMALPAYRLAHPIAFSLYDENENYALYIDDDPKDKYPLFLELRNTSARAIQFPNLGADASQQNHHFRLIFRAGTLSQKTLAKLVETKTPQGKKAILGDNDDWDIRSDGEDNLNGTTSIYFLLKNPSQPFLPTQLYKLALHAMTAQSGIGARGTRVELRLNDLTYIDTTDGVKITGSRVQHLQIVNHLGSRKIPLHVGFIGSNRILNDASPCDLTLQLMNVLRSESFDTKVTLTTKTEFLITFDVESKTTTKEIAPWSLCTEAEIDHIKIFVAKTHTHSVQVTRDGKPVTKTITNVPMNDNGEPVEDTVFWQVKREDQEQGESPVWRISPKTELILDRDDYIQIFIDNIITSLPSGFTNLYLTYKNIPGFWDGQIVCAIEKAPLLFRQDRTKYNKTPLKYDYLIATPQNVLDIRSSVAIGRNYVEPRPDFHKPRLLVNGDIAIGNENADALIYPNNGFLRIYGDLNVDRAVNIQGERLTFPSMDKKGWHYIERLNNPNKTNLPDNVPSGLVFQIVDGGYAKISLKSERNTATNANDQFITFSTKEGHDIRNGDIFERMRIAANGNVGIGTRSPGAKLTVMGGLHIGGESDPGDNNLQVDGKLHVAGVTSLNGGIEEKLSLFIKNLNTTVATIFFKSTPMKPGETSAYLSNGKLVFQTLTDGEMKTRMEISHDGHVSFAGYISEQLEIVHVTTDVGWGNPDQPLPQYFRKKLEGKPKGTLLRVLTDLDKWKNHYFEGWIGDDEQLYIIPHHP